MSPRDTSPADDGPEGELHDERHIGSRDLTRWSAPLGWLLVGPARWAARLLGPHQALVLVLAVGAVLSSAMTWLASETYEDVVAADGVASLDQPLLEAMVGMRVGWLDTAATAYTNLGGVLVMPVLAVAVMLGLAGHRRSWTPVILIAGAGIGSVLMTIAGKDLIGRARPPLATAVPPYEHSPSFPSGHSLNSLVVAGIVAYVLVLRQDSRRARILTITAAVLFAATMGLSRVFLGHHWFTDVLAAWTLGAAWLVIVITAHRLYLTLRRSQREERRGEEPTGSRGSTLRRS